MGRKIEEYKLELDKNPNIFLSYVLVMRNRQSFQPGIMADQAYISQCIMVALFVDSMGSP